MEFRFNFLHTLAVALHGFPICPFGKADGIRAIKHITQCDKGIRAGLGSLVVGIAVGKRKPLIVFACFHSAVINFPEVKTPVHRRDCGPIIIPDWIFLKIPALPEFGKLATNKIRFLAIQPIKSGAQLGILLDFAIGLITDGNRKLLFPEFDRVVLTKPVCVKLFPCPCSLGLRISRTALIGYIKEEFDVLEFLLIKSFVKPFCSSAAEFQILLGTDFIFRVLRSTFVKLPVTRRAKGRLNECKDTSLLFWERGDVICQFADKGVEVFDVVFVEVVRKGFFALPSSHSHFRYSFFINPFRRIRASP